MTRIVYRTARSHAATTCPTPCPGRRSGPRHRTSGRDFGRTAALVAILSAGPLHAGEPLGEVATGIADATDDASSAIEWAAPSAFRPFLEPVVPDDVSAAVADRLVFASMFEPGGIERPHWRSFDGVRPDLPSPAADPARFVVAIDPGHGGSDPGAEGPNGLLEKHLTLDIARRVRLFLSEFDDVEVVLTRERDHGLSRGSRVAAVRRSEADLFVSLHFNHLPQSGITLVESYYAGEENIAESLALQQERDGAPATARHASTRSAPDLAFTRGSARFADLVQRRVFDEVGRDNEAALDAGVKRDTLFVLTRSFTSGALIELTCLSNAEEAERLTDEGYRDALAAGLADAIREYRASLDTNPLDGNDV